MENLELNKNEYFETLPQTIEMPQRGNDFWFNDQIQTDNNRVIELRQKLNNFPATIPYGKLISEKCHEDEADWVEKTAKIKALDLNRTCPEVSNKYIN